MIDYGLTPEQKSLRQTAAEVSRERLAGPTAVWEESGNVDFDYLSDVLRGVGFLGMTLPTEYGGGGASFFDFVLVMEELAKASYPAAYLLQATSSGPVAHVERLATPRLRKTVLSEIVASGATCAIAITESEAGSDVGNVRTRAKDLGDGTVAVTGQKLFVGGAGMASYYVVYARMADRPGTDGIGCVLVPADTPGISFGAQANMLGSRAGTRQSREVRLRPAMS